MKALTSTIAAYAHAVICNTCFVPAFSLTTVQVKVSHSRKSNVFANENCNRCFHHLRRSVAAPKSSTCSDILLLDEWSDRRSLFSKANVGLFLSIVLSPQEVIASDGGVGVGGGGGGSGTRKPWAPTEALLPATRVRLLLDRAIELADKLQQLRSMDNNKEQEEILSQLGSILVPPSSIDDLKPNKSIRLAFNTYTAYLRYDDKFTLNGTPSDKKKLIREDRIPDVKQVITADLDLRDLYRNEVLTNVDEARAELRYQMDEFAKGNEVDGEELQRLLKAAGDACDDWFNLISADDVKEALDTVLGAAAGVTIDSN